MSVELSSKLRMAFQQLDVTSVVLGAIVLLSLTLAAKRRRRVTAIVWRFLSVCPSVRLSVHRNPLLLNGKGRYRESTHS